MPATSMKAAPTPSSKLLPPPVPHTASSGMSKSISKLPAACQQQAQTSAQYQQQQYLPRQSEEGSENDENEVPYRPSSLSNSSSSSSRESEGTQYTSLTQIKERPLSTDSHTVVRVPLV